jgi:HemX protein
VKPVPVLYDGMTFLYAVCVLLCFIDFLHPKKSLARAALWFIAMVWLMQSLLLVERAFDLGHFPIYSLSESLILFAWLLLTFSLVIQTFFNIDLFTFFSNLIGFAVVVFDLFTGPSRTVPLAEQGDLLAIHITMAFLSYAAFSMAFIFSLMYLIQERLLKEKRWTETFRRLPALDRLDAYAYRLVLVGFPLLLLSMILGVIWYDIQFHRLLWWDPKPVVSILLVILYGAYLYLRAALSWRGKQLAWLNVFSFGVVIVNYLIVGTVLAGFHRW